MLITSSPESPQRHQPSLFNSFFQGSFPCSTACRSEGKRLDMIISSGHDMLAHKDYAALAEHRLLTARDGARWYLIEKTPGEYDWSSFLPMVHAASQHGIQVIWEVAHFGYPDHLDIWSAGFVDAFARFARAMAEVMQNEGVEQPFFTPINQISFWSWAGAEVAWLNPYASGRGLALKKQLVRASLAAIAAIRDVCPQARFVLTEPLVHVAPVDESAAAREEARRQHLSQFDAWDMLCGTQCPELGGSPEALDIIGLNYYPDNQRFNDGSPLNATHSAWRPLHLLLQEVWQRYQRPMLLTETGAEGEARVNWLNIVAEEVELALEQGVAMEGISLYPVVEYPAWADDHRTPGSLFGLPDPNGSRTLYEPLALALRSQQIKLQNRGKG
ncbi:beta-glucosidase [Mixta theicola]|uniref:Beta-glucosidase n=1 Tax=Mixta theicola TaxID=1458355 RepID=A0A2K1QEG6_9GAMM|nr:beta-glucosidase [Mixta theicola]PNS13422.1 beta-glucosidase [Mixta theicola]GLR09733.1 beta-glucosidase [Mixta theicola]